MAFALSSPAFTDGGSIPRKYTADGTNVSPPLRWSQPPAQARSFAVICEDPDAPSGTFRHWLLANIPADVHELDEDVQIEGTMREARNDFGDAAYGGPAPPPGHGVHHYRFRIMALDTDRLDVKSTVDAQRFQEMLAPHVIAETQTIGTYQR